MILEDFAGPGGWDQGAADIGLRGIVGVEWDRDACLTATAAGHLRIRGDVSRFAYEHLTDLDGYIASPPCPTFSTAGKGGGRGSIALICAALWKMAAGDDGWPMIVRDAVYAEVYPLRLRDALAVAKTKGLPVAWAEERAEVAARREAFTTSLILEPLRRVRDLRPRWVAMEQVPPCLPVWQEYARILREWGYRVETAVLNAADFGVPQTRKRAIFSARLDDGPLLPEPTHAKHPQASLFGPELAPWVSMAEALGWGYLERPCTTVIGGSNRGGGTAPLDGGSGSRAAAAAAAAAGTFLVESDRGRGMVDRHGPRVHDPSAPAPAPALRGGTGAGLRYSLDRRQNGAPTLDPTLVPAPTIVGSALGKGVWVVRTGANTMKHSRDNADLVPYERSIDEPAPTLDQKVRSAWKVSLRAGAQANATERTIDAPAPAPAVLGSWDNGDTRWAFERPATTIVGSFCPDVVAAPDYRLAGDGPRQDAPGSISISISDAARLQSFPADYPWKGSKSSCFLQVGNAIPCGLAAAILRPLLEAS